MTVTMLALVGRSEFMARISLADWPLILVEMSERFDQDDRASIFDALALAIEREGRFGVVVQMPLAPPVDRPKQDLDRMRWLKLHKAEIGRRCAGMAFVLRSDAMRATAVKALANAPRMWGCAAAGFDGVPEACAWARARLAEASAGD